MGPLAPFLNRSGGKEVLLWRSLANATGERVWTTPRIVDVGNGIKNHPHYAHKWCGFFQRVCNAMVYVLFTWVYHSTHTKDDDGLHGHRHQP